MATHDRLTAFLLVAAAICLTVTGELFLKSGMNRVGAVNMHDLLATIRRAVALPQIWVGFGFVFGGAMIWLSAISRAPLSWAYPILSLGYVLILVLSRLFLGETVPLTRWLGTLIIVAGVWLVFRS